jgi:hypothetical protein
VFERRELSRIFGPESVFIIGGRTQLYNYELHNLYSSPNRIIIIKSRAMRLTESVERIGEKSYRGLVGKPEGKRPLGKPRFR